MTITSTTTPADEANPDTHICPGDRRTVGDSGQPLTDADDWYFATLRTLSARAVTAKAALLDAHLAPTPRARTAALVDLHHHLRAMAGIVNDALGSMGAPQEPR